MTSLLDTLGEHLEQLPARLRGSYVNQLIARSHLNLVKIRQLADKWESVARYDPGDGMRPIPPDMDQIRRSIIKELRSLL